MPENWASPALIPNNTGVIHATIRGERRPGDDWTSPRAAADWLGVDVSDANARPLLVMGNCD